MIHVGKATKGGTLTHRFTTHTKWGTHTVKVTAHRTNRVASTRWVCCTIR